MDIRFYLDKIVETFKEELKDSLAGIYLHGSLAMGCFHPSRSDIDLLVIAKEKRTKDEYRRIAGRLISIHEELSNEGGIEVSIVLETYLQNFIYPTPFEFHYSSFHRENYKKDENYICGGFEDPDLAAHFVVAYHRGIALYGKPFREIYSPIDRQYYLDSIFRDIEGAVEEILEKPVYYALNLCRVLYFLQEGVVSSKKEGGEWGSKVLPLEYKELVRQCLHEYSSLTDQIELTNQPWSDFARYMLSEIRLSTERGESFE